MRQHVREFVVASMEALGLKGRACKVVELGSLVVEGQEAVALRPAVLELCPGSEYLGVDMRAGPGVDLVDNIESTGLADWDRLWGKQEIVLCVDTLEHVGRPWAALGTLRDLVRAGGLAIVAVPFAFPIHEYPHDYYRYTQDGLRKLLEAGFRDVWTAQDPPGSLLPHTVVAVAKRIHEFTPQERAALDAACARWLTRAESLLPNPPGASLMVTMSDASALVPVQAAVKAVLGGESLEARYQRLCAEPSDINEHLPTLRRLAAECRTVCELGTRGAVSTTALLAGLVDGRNVPRVPESGLGAYLRLVDVDPRALGLALATLGPLAGRVAVDVVVTDSSSSVALNGTTWDLLFVDSLHTYEHLKAELDLHVFKHAAVTKYIVLHDTTTFGLRGEDGTEPGLQQAVSELLEACEGAWEVFDEYTNNNGLLVLKRIGPRVLHG